MQLDEPHRTTPLNLLSSAPVMPCGATVRAEGLSTSIEGEAETEGPFESLTL
jgi:hypothetical protein